jgi:serralysin
MLYTDRTVDSTSSAALDVASVDSTAVSITEAVNAPPLPAADTVPGGISSAVTIAVGGSADVIIETLGDHDWYRVTLVAGTTYTIQTSSDGSGTDAFLNLRDAAGTLISSDDDAGDGVNSLITFTATTTGTYYIDAGTYNDDTTGSYHLFVAGLNGEVEPNNTLATAGSLALGGSTSGQINASGDHDLYAINLVAGQTYIFRTAATAATDATDTTLTLRNAVGTQLLTNDDAGEAGFSAIRFTATTTGTYYLDVAGFGTSTGAYNITAFTAPTPVVYTNDQIANQLTNGYWGGGSHHFNVGPGGTLTFNVTGLTVDGANLARAALALWSDVTGINFNEVAVGGQLVYDDNQTGAFASAVYSGGITTSATINVGTAWITSYGTGLNTYSFQTYIHETGHALGLGHGGNYNGSADYSSDSLYLNDSWATTIMSYFDQVENTYFQAQGFTRQFVETPMIADGIAVAALYGTNTLTRTGNTTYGFNNTSGRDIYDATLYPSIGYTIYDNGGADNLDYSGFAQNQLINLNEETFSNIGGRVGNVSIARGTVIENARGGSGTDTIIGNSADNLLFGGTGADSLYGGGGDDRLDAETGDAVLDGGTGIDQVIYRASGTITGSLTGLEAIRLIGAPSVTMSQAQFESGFAATSIVSGAGSLIINMDVANPDLQLQQLQAEVGSTVTLTINGSSAVNTVKSAPGIALTYNGGAQGDQIRGSQLADTIFGNGGDDKIAGANGADIITGGSGADTFRFLSASNSGVGAAADQITDYQIGIDKLGFTLIDTDPIAVGDQGFAFIGNALFGATGAAQMRYMDSGANLLVQADINGDGIVDMEVVLQGLAGQALTGGDFLL